ncbi:hypothetical protein [Caulobacter sp. BK020]|uniref:hypothetical protein n=1 Tax=Caulobacter sp. BK020 TaxID=2512117 RepID=UPI00104DF7B4|nr:hypothetical protein [Caulobacter sp. BK020]TCS18453.1 hypothetical protein EV278_101438 [Caulobacter sp. BK020]
METPSLTITISGGADQATIEGLQEALGGDLRQETRKSGELVDTIRLIVEWAPAALVVLKGASSVVEGADLATKIVDRMLAWTDARAARPSAAAQAPAPVVAIAGPDGKTAVTEDNRDKLIALLIEELARARAGN